jgi:hypothetical protein
MITKLYSEDMKGRGYLGGTDLDVDIILKSYILRGCELNWFSKGARVPVL